MKSHLMGTGVVAPQAQLPLGTHASHIILPGLSPCYFMLLLMCLKGSRNSPGSWVPVTYLEVPDWIPSYWLRPVCGERLLGSEPVDGKSLSLSLSYLCPSAFQICNIHNIIRSDLIGLSNMRVANVYAEGNVVAILAEQEEIHTLQESWQHNCGNQV